MFVRLPTGADLMETSKHFLSKKNLEKIPLFSKPADSPWCITIAPKQVTFMDTPKLQDSAGILCATPVEGEQACSGPGCNIKYPVSINLVI